MKIINEKGRLFGILNIFDLLLVNSCLERQSGGLRIRRSVGWPWNNGQIP